MYPFPCPVQTTPQKCKTWLPWLLKDLPLLPFPAQTTPQKNATRGFLGCLKDLPLLPLPVQTTPQKRKLWRPGRLERFTPPSASCSNNSSKNATRGVLGVLKDLPLLPFPVQTTPQKCKTWLSWLLERSTPPSASCSINSSKNTRHGFLGFLKDLPLLPCPVQTTPQKCKPWLPGLLERFTPPSVSCSNNSSEKCKPWLPWLLERSTPPSVSCSINSSKMQAVASWAA